jgi:hypothetical protein
MPSQLRVNTLIYVCGKGEKHILIPLSLAISPPHGDMLNAARMLGAISSQP